MPEVGPMQDLYRVHVGNGRETAQFITLHGSVRRIPLCLNTSGMRVSVLLR